MPIAQECPLSVGDIVTPLVFYLADIVRIEKPVKATTEVNGTQDVMKKGIVFNHFSVFFLPEYIMLMNMCQRFKNIGYQ